MENLRLRAIRGATTLEADTPEQLEKRVGALLGELLAQNGIAPNASIENFSTENITSIFFTTTQDISAGFPATAARKFGLNDVPLLGAQEQAVEGALSLCVRVLIHFYTDRQPQQLKHIYLEGARSLRDDVMGEMT